MSPGVSWKVVSVVAGEVDFLSRRWARIRRMTKRIGLSRFIRDSLPVEILTAQLEAGLVIIGDNPQASLNQMGEQQEVLESLKGFEFRDRVVFLG